MSYAFQVRKRGGTLEFLTSAETLKITAAHIPDGAVFTLNGHTPSDDSSSVGSVGVTLTTSDETTGQSAYLGQATGSYNTRVG